MGIEVLSLLGRVREGLLFLPDADYSHMLLNHRPSFSWAIEAECSLHDVALTEVGVLGPVAAQGCHNEVGVHHRLG
jgi:hypothetical protein